MINFSRQAVHDSYFNDIYLYGIVAVSAVLIFSGLGDRAFWQDEAETAMYARAILRTGVPSGFDGLNWTSQLSGMELLPDGTLNPARSPWAQFYIAAAGMALFGENEWGARAPFALLGLICVFGMYRAARTIADDAQVARLAALAMAFAVPFLLQARQSRGYTLILAATLLVVIYVFDRRKHAAWAGLAGAGLFYINHFFYAGVVAALLVAVGGERHADLRKRVWISTLFSAALALPGIAAYLYLGRQFPSALIFDVNGAADRGLFYLKSLLTAYLPLPVILFLAVRRLGNAERICVRFILVYMIFLLPFSQHYDRYLILLLPFCSLLLAIMLWSVIRRWRAFGIASAALVLGTNVLHLWPADWINLVHRRPDAVGPPQGATVPLYWYGRELTGSYIGPDRALADFINRYGQEAETALITYGDVTLQFYTRLKIVGGYQGRKFDESTAPEFIIIRDYIHTRTDQITRDVAFKIMELTPYARVDLSVIDSAWGNRPDPVYHPFVEPTSGEPLHVWVRRDIYDSRVAGHSMPNLRNL